MSLPQPPPERSHALTSHLKSLPPGRAISPRNVTCCYCGRPFGEALLPTKEHVIGRRFVPKGCLSGQWNLILRACGQCNADKAALEDDISAITMLPDLLGRFAVNDPRLTEEARRKAVNARSRRTGKAVGASHEEIKLHGQFGPATFTFSFTAPAQVEEARIFRLAHYHFRAFFYWITYREETGLGGFPPGDFRSFLATRRSDWGSPRMRWFMDTVRDWDVRIHAIGADGFFKLIIRKHPDGAHVWAWAVEWNHGMRVVGFVGDRELIQGLCEPAPHQPLEVVHGTASERFAFRTEVALDAEQDDLFTVMVELEEPDGGEGCSGRPIV